MALAPSQNKLAGGRERSYRFDTRNSTVWNKTAEYLN